MALGRKSLKPLISGALILAFILAVILPASSAISVLADEEISQSAYTWTDSSGNTQTDGISTSDTSTSYDVYGTNTSDYPTITLSGVGTFTLTGDMQADLVVSGTVILDLNGHTLTGTGISSVITIKNGGSLTIQDTSTDADGEITGGVGTCWSSSYGFADEDTCELTYITQTAYGMHGGGVFVCAGGSLTMTGGTITGNTALGADITHTSRSANGGYGGGIFFASNDSAQSAFEMSGGTISGNEAYGGGGIGAMAKSSTYNLTLYIHGSSTKVNGNTASYGGGVYLKSNADLRLYDGASVSDNTASSGSGGGIYASSGSVYINNGSYAGTKVTISGNCAGGSGGGIYASGTYLNINNNGADIKDNTAGTSGGGIYCGATVINLNSSNVTVSGNTAGSYGGGVYFKATGKGKSASSFALQVTGNTANVGGGIYVYGSSSYYLTLTTASSAMIANNTAVTAAADIYCSSYSTLSIANNNNTAQTFAGDGQSQTITGWYDDSSGSRWAAAESPSAVSISSGTEYYLIAAYSSEHSYGTGTWEWTGSDGAGYTRATLTVSCTVSGHTDTITTTVTPMVEIVSATCTADGYTSYTAAASVGGIDYTETKTVTSTTDKATGHTYSSNSNVQWSWGLSSSSGGYTAAAYVTCETCGSYIYSSATSGSYYDENLSVSVTTETEEDGIYYTATATYKVEDGEVVTWTCPYRYGPFVAATYTSNGALKSYYATLAEAFSGASSSYTVKLLCNATISDSMTMDKTTLTLDLNGCTLTYTGTDSAAFAVGSAESSSSRTLTVTDSSDSGTGAIRSTNGASIFAVYYALKINGGTFEVTSSGESTTAGAVVEGCGYAKNTYIWQYDDNGKMTGYTTTSTNCGCTVTVTGGIFNSTFYKENETYDGLTTVAISGGWFTTQVAEDHCADGYKPYASATGTAADGVEGMYTVGTFSAKIDYSSSDEDEKENEDSSSDDDEDYTYTYDPSGTSVAFTVTFDGSTQESNTYSVKYTQITTATDEDDNAVTTEIELDDGTLPTDVGTYTATVVSNDSSAFVGSGEAVTFTIVQDTGTYITFDNVSEEGTITATYSGSAASVSAKAYTSGDTEITSDEEGKELITITWYTAKTEAEDGTVTYSGALESAPTDAGTYYAVASIAETDNYTAAKAAVTVVIGKADQTVSFKDIDEDEDGSLTASAHINAGSVSYTATSTGDGEVTYSIESYDEGFSIDSSTGKVTFTGAGTATITASAAESTNYNAASATYTLTVTGHDYEAVVTEPTCTEKGYTTYTCSVCGDTYTDDYTDATGHTYGEAVVENEVEANCTQDGSYDNVVYCTVCGAEISRETVTIDATGHTEGEAVVENKIEATCTQDGSYDSVVYCTVCGEEISRETVTVAATGHSAGEAVTENEIEATCTQDGSYDSVIYCTVCGAEISRETVTINATGHTEGEAVVENKIEATCTEDGSYDTVVYCTVCGEEISRETITVEATGHSYEAVVTEPTCTEDGYTTYACSVCGDAYTDDYTDATGHSYEITDVAEATGTEDGYIVYTCSICGDTYTEVLEATGSSEGSVSESTQTSENVAAEASVDEEALAVSVLGSEAYEELISSGSDIDFTLVITDEDVSEDDTSLVEAYITSGYSVGLALDITLYCTITDAEGETTQKVTSTGDTSYTITLTIPEELVNTDSSVTRTYAVIRVHDGEAEEIASAYDEAENTLTFSADRFSTYAIVYADTSTASEETTTEETTEEETTTEETTEETTAEETTAEETTKEETTEETTAEETTAEETTASSDSSEAATGDVNDLLLWICIAALAAAAAAAIGLRRRFN